MCKKYFTLKYKDIGHAVWRSIVKNLCNQYLWVSSNVLPDFWLAGILWSLSRQVLSRPATGTIKKWSMLISYFHQLSSWTLQFYYPLARYRMRWRVPIKKVKEIPPLWTLKTKINLVVCAVSRYESILIVHAGRVVDEIGCDTWAFGRPPARLLVC